MPISPFVVIFSHLDEKSMFFVIKADIFAVVGSFALNAVPNLGIRQPAQTKEWKFMFDTFFFMSYLIPNETAVDKIAPAEDNFLEALQQALPGLPLKSENEENKTRETVGKHFNEPNDVPR